MCHFPSWIETEDGEALFLTDKDFKNPIFKYDDAYDMIGHSAILKLYGLAKGSHEEGFPCHPEVFKAIKAGKMKKMMKAAGYKNIRLDEKGNFNNDTEPSAVYLNGTMAWYKNGKLHRKNGPAVEYPNGRKEWYKNGKCHREDGPAIEYANGDRFWFKNGFYHREDGPAIEYSNGVNIWYMDGKRMSREEFRKIRAKKGKKK